MKPASESLPLVRKRLPGYDLGAMDGTASACLPGPSPAPTGFRLAMTDWVVLAILLVWQGWMTLSLFGPSEPISNLLNDQPIVSGRHPLHLYHGCLGAQTFWERRSLTCFDPAFQAGYPKTPVYDSGSRPAEFFLIWGRGEYRPHFYKIGLACTWILVPIGLWLAASSLGMVGGVRGLAVLLALLAWWGRPAAALTGAGDLDLLLGSVALLVLASLLARLHCRPTALTFVGVFVAATLSWFTHPVLCLLYAPVVLIYYVSFGPRHSVAWHLGLLAAQGGALLLNGFWLVEWFEYWWVLSPLRVDEPFLAHRTVHLLWNSPHWGDPFDRALTWILFCCGLGGVVIWNQTGRRPAARLIGSGVFICLVVSIAGVIFDPLTRWGAHRLLVPALLFASMPAALCLGVLASGVNRLAYSNRIYFGVITASAVTVLIVLWPLRSHVLARCTQATPLEIGLSEPQKAFTRAIGEWTTPEARILLESTFENENDSRWSSLLPIITERAFLGGLDPEASIEHAFANFVHQDLAGRPIERWRDEELANFVRRYNVGWVACRSKAAVERFGAWGDAKLIAGPGDAGGAWLFRLQPRSFVLQGRARVVHADRQGITLADVGQGKVVLSMHYQTGMHVLPNQVNIEKDPDASDPIPFIRLNVPNPVARLVIYWRDP